MIKPSFILYMDMYDSILDAELTQEEKGELLDLIFLFARGEPIPAASKNVKVAFAFIGKTMERDAAHYYETCEKRSEAGKKSGIARAAKAEQKRTKRTNVKCVEQNEQMLNVLNKSEQTRTKRTDSDSDSDSDNDSERDTTSRPALADIIEYCNKENIKTDCEKFYNYYAAKNWHTASGEAITDWRAQLKVWASRDKDFERDTKAQENKTAFHNLERQQYDFDALEKQLLGINK